jgi:hypothetical protein
MHVCHLGKLQFFVTSIANVRYNYFTLQQWQHRKRIHNRYKRGMFIKGEQVKVLHGCIRKQTFKGTTIRSTYNVIMIREVKSLPIWVKRFCGLSYANYRATLPVLEYLALPAICDLVWNQPSSFGIFLFTNILITMKIWDYTNLRKNVDQCSAHQSLSNVGSRHMPLCLCPSWNNHCS